MNAEAIIAELKLLGDEGYKSILLKHGVVEPCFGVKIGELKKLQKRIKKDHRLALDLYESGNYDAMYLAGLIADDSRMTKTDLNRWVRLSKSEPLCGTTVASVAAGSPCAWEIAQEWIDSKDGNAAVAGWATLSALVSIKDDDELDLKALRTLVQRVKRSIHRAPDRVRYVMNSFVISVAAYVDSLTNFALEAAESIGQVHVDMGATACKVPYAPDYIRKIQHRGTIGKKRKSAKC